MHNEMEGGGIPLVFEWGKSTCYTNLVERAAHMIV